MTLSVNRDLAPHDDPSARFLLLAGYGIVNSVLPVYISMTTSTINQVKALIQLLCSEENRTNSKLVRQRLIELGTGCVPFLEEAMNRVDLPERERLESVLQEIRWKGLEAQFGSWAEEGGDLEEGAFLLAQFRYPNMDLKKYKEILDEIAGEAQSRIKSASSSAGVVRAFCRYLFYDLGFHGSTLNYYDPDNSYINRVIDQRVGIPISLSVVMLLLAKRIGLPIAGVGLPGHFLTRYEGKGQEIYIDAFSRGRVLTKEECKKFIKAAGYGYREEYFLTSAAPQILVRMMRNLIFVYNQLKETQKVEWLSRFVETVS